MIKGYDLLDTAQQLLIIERTVESLARTAITENNLINWPPCIGKIRPGREKMLVQMCHGAPGIIVALAGLWSSVHKILQDIILEGGELIWRAGPLAKPWGICHGTAGNGYAFLKLFKSTNLDFG